MTDLSVNNIQNKFNCSDQAGITWAQRAIVCASFVKSLSNDDQSSITLADIGCGDQKLKEILAGLEMNLLYQGYDLILQNKDVVSLDISRNDLPREFDIGVMLGVIEYLPNLTQMFSHLSQSVKHLVVSHVIRQSVTYDQNKLQELGWVNHLRESELIALVSEAGFNVVTQELTPDKRTLVLLCHSRAL